ncbi:hypothetical protein CEXT_275561 [Caerostris extrusa]|uniref:Uncharacterized protein n=1 Tax=Caerostris extrusa TaxID=172846 RepID=A0AAV4PEQ4_CAEEX|nr:hypothetical protein CEXT_275561 [Caerostris extrusa]
MAQKGAGYCGRRKLWGEDGSPLGFVRGTIKGPYLRLMTSITTFRECYCFWTSRGERSGMRYSFYLNDIWGDGSGFCLGISPFFNAELSILDIFGLNHLSLT